MRLCRVEDFIMELNNKQAKVAASKKTAPKSGLKMASKTKSKKASKASMKERSNATESTAEDHKSHALIRHELLEKKGRAAPLPKNYPYKKRMARAKYEIRKQVNGCYASSKAVTRQVKGGLSSGLPST